MCVDINVFLLNYYFSTQLSHTYICYNIYLLLFIYVQVYPFSTI
jgi:hypothetical protein